MMELPVMSQTGTSSHVQVAEELFDCPFNEGLVHQVVTAYMAGGRAGTKAQKTRSAVRGGGIKPWKQKGTGRARAGSIRSPLWRGGGKVFAATPRCYQQKINRRMYKQALRSIFSELVRQGRLKIVDHFTVDTPKTKDLVNKLQNFQVNKVFIVIGQEDINLCLAAGNIPHVEVKELNYMDPVSLVAYEHVLVTVETLKKIEEKLR
jgi:large subunit ribosomal protein L4